MQYTVMSYHIILIPVASTRRFSKLCPFCIDVDGSGSTRQELQAKSEPNASNTIIYVYWYM